MMFIRHAQSEWNHHFGRTRIDPGIEDPALTDVGRTQAVGLIERLADAGLTELIASPYRRNLETATIVAQALGLAVSVNVLVRERCFFSCDIGSSPEVLALMWPDIDFSGLTEKWWGQPPESEAAIAERCDLFRRDHPDLLERDDVAVISHWGFIRAFTGQEVENAEILHVRGDDTMRPSS